jgi:peptidoglycan hydrolase-like protein with peptidoglycan-binding domain
MIERIAALRDPKGLGSQHFVPVSEQKAPAESGPAMIALPVDQIQLALNRLGTRPVLEVDGVLGPATRAAVLDFQRIHGLVGDWAPGSRTCETLTRATAHSG